MNFSSPLNRNPRTKKQRKLRRESIPQLKNAKNFHVKRVHKRGQVRNSPNKILITTREKFLFFKIDVTRQQNSL